MNIHRIIYSAIFCVGALITSCSTDEQVGGNADCQPIAFTATGIVSASQSRAIDGNKWEYDTEVAIMVGSETKRYVPIVSNDERTEARLTANGVTPFYWKSLTDEVTAKAWIPYSDDYPSVWTVKTDQSSDENYTNSDLLMANATATYGNALKLEFSHLLSKVTINLVKGVGDPDLTGAKVELIDVMPTLSYIGSTPQATGDAQSITVINNGTDGTTTSGSCIVPPQTLATDFVRVTLKSGSTLVGSFSTAPTLAASNEYTYNVTVTLNSLTIYKLSIAKWEDGSNTTAEAEF